MKQHIKTAFMAMTLLFCTTIQANNIPVTREMFPADADYMGFFVAADHMTILWQKVEKAFPELKDTKELFFLMDESDFLEDIMEATKIDFEKDDLPNLIKGGSLSIKVNVPEERFGIFATLTGDIVARDLLKALHAEFVKETQDDSEVAKHVTIQEVANGFTGTIKVSNDDKEYAYTFSLLVEGETLTLRAGDYMDAFEPITTSHLLATKLPTDRTRTVSYGIIPDLQNTLTNNDVLPLEDDDVPEEALPFSRIMKITFATDETSDMITHLQQITAGSIEDAKTIYSKVSMLKGMGMMLGASQEAAKDSALAVAMINAFTIVQPEGTCDIVATQKYDLPLIKLLVEYSNDEDEGRCDCEDGCDCEECDCVDCNCEEEDEVVDLDALIED